MSLVITVYTREGIVMASDSRLTLWLNQGQAKLSIPQTDSNYKTFVSPHHIGISTAGAADIQGVPISGYIESFIREQLSESTVTVTAAAEKLLAYFRAMAGPPESAFIVGGYETEGGKKVPRVYSVSVSGNFAKRVNPDGIFGAQWNGELDVLQRMIQPVAMKDEQGKYHDLQYHQIPWNFFTLQDGIDFAVFAVRATIDVMRFQSRAKTVGGAIDVLVIKPDSSTWVKRKELSA